MLWADSESGVAQRDEERTLAGGCGFFARMKNTEPDAAMQARISNPTW
jgi:hypothetical protein